MKIKRFRQKKYPSYSVGDRGPAGGIIFMTPSTAGNASGQYFELAKNMYPNNDYVGNLTVGKLYLPDNIYPSLPDYIGAGKQNTKILLEIFSTYLSDSGYLLKDLIDYRNSSSHKDWFIPSLSELEKAWQAQNYSLFLGSGNQKAGYGEWVSSSSDNPNTMYYMYVIPPELYSPGQMVNYITGAYNPTTGTLNFFGKYYLMPVRSFYPYGV